MVADVDICNLALQHVKGTRITSLGQGSDSANACLAIYETRRDDLMSMVLWKFAMAYFKCPRLAEEPLVGFKYAYRLPTDFIRLANVYTDERALRNTNRYKLEGKKVLSDYDDVWVRYVRRIVDPNDMPEWWRNLLAEYMAILLSISVRSNRTLSEYWSGEFRKSLRRCRSIDSMQDMPEQFPESSWDRVRGGTHGGTWGGGRR